MSLDVDDLIRRLHLKIKREVIASLLAGNDTQCFTTEQYADGWNLHQKYDAKTAAWMKEGFLDTSSGESLAHRQLRISRLVREVKPDVWAAVESDP